jgi:hypothetical protein
MVVVTDLETGRAPGGTTAGPRRAIDADGDMGRLGLARRMSRVEQRSQSGRSSSRGAAGRIRQLPQ